MGLCAIRNITKRDARRSVPVAIRSVGLLLTSKWKSQTATTSLNLSTSNLLTMSADEVAKAFVNHFYQTFDANCDGLAGLYVSLQLLLAEMRSSGSARIGWSFRYKSYVHSTRIWVWSRVLVEVHRPVCFQNDESRFHRRYFASTDAFVSHLPIPLSYRTLNPCWPSKAQRYKDQRPSSPKWKASVQ